MNSPKGTTAILFIRFTIFYTIPIVFVLFLMKIVFSAPLFASVIVIFWDVIVMSALFSFLHSVFRYRFREGGGEKSRLMVTQRITVGGDLGAIREKLISGVGEIGGFRFLDMDNNPLIGITVMSFNSLGEIIRIDIYPETSEVEISSRPAFNACLADGGKNRRNVEKIISAIR